MKIILNVAKFEGYLALAVPNKTWKFNCRDTLQVNGGTSEFYLTIKLFFFASNIHNINNNICRIIKRYLLIAYERSSRNVDPRDIPVSTDWWK